MSDATKRGSPEKRAMRIGLIAHAGLGGSGTVATDLAAGLAERGHDVHMITPKRPFRMALSERVQVHAVTAPPHEMWESAPWTLALASRIAEVAVEAELDVLHAHFAIPYGAATEWACQMLGPAAPPWVITLHGSDVEPLGLDPAYAPVVRHAVRRARRITVPSRYLRALVAREFSPSRAIEVVPNFVDAERFCPSPDRVPPSAAGAVLIHASNFRAVKRIADVVAIFAKVAARTPTRLLLIGDGPERGFALERLAALGLADRVEAPGAQTDVEQWLRRAHVALLPSERESFGLAALEALAAGVPVVGSRVGGLPEVVQNGMGLLANVGDVDAMAHAAHALVTDDESWTRAAQSARAHATKDFSPERAFDAYLATYRAAIAGASTERTANEATSSSSPS